MSLDLDRLRSLVVTALDLPAEVREEYLRATCPDDALLEAALKLLRFHPSEAGADVDGADADGAEAQETRVVSPFPPPSASSRLDPAESLTQIGRYEIHRRIGQGGMGVVYLARDPDLDREVAIKQLPGRLAESSEWLDQFREEARTLAQLNHPNIATIHSLETDQDRPFLTMEFVSGETLAELLKSGPMETDEVLTLVLGVAGALEAAHDRGIAHLDLKPDNIMVGDDHRPRILDFGLARRFETKSSDAEVPSDDVSSDSGSPDADSPRETPLGVAGTPGYMSPERVRSSPAMALFADVSEVTDPTELGSIRSDARPSAAPHLDAFAADAWSFGCVLFECLTGLRAFGGTAEERLRTTLSSPAPLDLLPAQTPAPLRHIVEQCLTKNTDERLTSFRTVRRIVESVIERKERDRLQSLNTRGADRPSLPRYLTRFHGREQEVETIAERLGTHRLVTLTGFGGSGKTRLAVEALSVLAEESVWVDLLAIDHPDQVLVSFLSAFGVKEPGNDPVGQVMHLLGDSDTVLLLDNCEHVLSRCRELLQRILPQCPRVRVLATSREPLGLDGEIVIPVSPLPVPAGDGDSPENPALRLFLDRAESFGAVITESEEARQLAIEICRRLEGIPLALEIAAGQLDVLGLGELNDRLDSRIELPSEPSGARHRSLRSVIDWSFDRLSAAEKTMLCRMSLLPSSWTLATAEAVGLEDPGSPWRAFEIVKGLVRASLLQRESTRDPDSPSRFRMLETVAEYAREQLRENEIVGDEASARLAFVRYYHQLLDRESYPISEFHRLSQVFRLEDDNVSGALDQLRDMQASRGVDVDKPEAKDLAVACAELTLDASRFWNLFGRYDEWIRRTETASEGVERFAAEERVLRCGVHLNRAEARLREGRAAEVEEIASTALDQAVELGHVRYQVRGLTLLGGAARGLGALPKALELLDQALDLIAASEKDALPAGTAVKEAELATILHNRAVVLLHVGQPDEADKVLRKSLKMQEALGNELGTASCVNAIGAVASLRGQYSEALSCYERSLAIRRRHDDVAGMMMSLGNLGRVAANVALTDSDPATRWEQATDWSKEGIELAKRAGDHVQLATLYLTLSLIQSQQGNLRAAIEVAKEALESARVAKSPNTEATALDVLSGYAIKLPDFEEAQSLGLKSFRIRLASSSVVAYQPLRHLALARGGLGDLKSAAILLACARAEVERYGARLVATQARDDERLWSQIESELGIETAEELAHRGKTTAPDEILSVVEFGPSSQ